MDSAKLFLIWIFIIGTESGDDEALLLARKGYTAANILKQCRKLDEAGIEYYFISVDSLTLFPDTELYHMEQEGRFIPAGEKERLQELQVFIRNLQIRTHLFANSSSNFYPVTAYLPKEYRMNLKTLG